ncbi:hypothetical protein LZC95_46440 [Pendulispora brunnea]|uniref:Peptide synthetase n=1 Tax=Pendulispora brunnea TaxID=2905690 RepID=A0ABZ2K5A4_9BACT
MGSADPQSPKRTFAFDDWDGHARGATEGIRQFAAHEALRSAMVEELELDDEFHRRAARPEDLSFIKFSRPVTPDTVTQLPFLASQRILLSIHELGIAGLPRDGSAESFDRVARFYDEEHRMLGAQILPFLEAFSFDFLEREAPSSTGVARKDELLNRLRVLVRTEAAFWGSVFGRFAETGYVEEGTRFALIQTWALAASKRAALARATASRFFEPLGPSLAPRLVTHAPSDANVRRLANRCGVKRQQHSYWQFYLSTSLASCNFLHALARRPDRALRLYGAAFAAEAEWVAFGCLTGMAGAKLGLEGANDVNDDGMTHSLVDDLAHRFEQTLDIVERRWGARGLDEVERGLGMAEVLGTSVRRNLGEQFRWLSSMDVYKEIAHRIDARIRAERPNIDRETFVEPREMCSTTHVHDDHRLVVIETGNMIFWGNLGMELRLAPGEMVLVPMGRLHGSSIESDECVYHQPIIPEDWVQSLVADLDPRGAAIRI